MALVDEAPSSVLADIAEPCQYGDCEAAARWLWQCVECEPSSVAFCDRHDRLPPSYRDITCTICGNRCWRVEDGWARSHI